MRIISSLLLVLGLTEFVAAHSLDGDQTWIDQLAHQLLSTHHLALIVILIAVCLMALDKYFRRTSGPKHK